jgi:hypothetical protein
MGFKKVSIDYIYGNCLAGKPSYNFSKLFGLAIDSFIILSTTPLMIFGWIGAFITFASFALGVFVGIEEFIMGEVRYSSLKRANPERAARLFAKSEAEAKERYENLVKLIDYYKAK